MSLTGRLVGWVFGVDEVIQGNEEKQRKEVIDDGQDPKFGIKRLGP